jgi:glycosyltransferase 2 family protein
VSCLRVVAAVGLTVALAYHVDWRALPGQLQNVSWPVALLAFVALGLQMIVGPWKWQAALRIHDLHFNLPFLIRAYGVGFFFNNLLPSGIGGDAYRVASTWPADRPGAWAISAVLIDRLAGFGALVLLAGIGALALPGANRLARTFALLAAGVLVGGILAVMLLRSGRVRSIPQRFRHIKPLAALGDVARHFRRGASSWIWLGLLSLVFHALTIVSIYLLFRSLGSSTSAAACSLIAAAAGFATIVPLSINGIGIVEGSFAGTAVALGTPYGVALAVALLMRLLVLPQSLAFGCLYLVNGEGRPPPPFSPTAARPAC